MRVPMIFRQPETYLSVIASRDKITAWQSPKFGERILQNLFRQPEIMSHYRRSQQKGGTFFFTVALANRQSNLLVQHIDYFKQAYRKVHAWANEFPTLRNCLKD